MKRSFLPLFLLSAPLSLPASAGTLVLNTSADFFTSPWAFGAPYVLDAGRDHLGISNVNPFGMSTSADNEWEETTYLKFDLETLGLVTAVTSAVLTFQTVARSGFPADESGMTISAHYLLSDPGTIDPNSASSYVGFKNTQIGGVADSVFTTSFGTYTLDVTDLVNDWILNGDANYAYGVALTGRVGNEASPDAWIAIVNSGYAGAPTLTITTTVPEASGPLLFSLGTILLLGKRRRV